MWRLKFTLFRCSTWSALSSDTCIHSAAALQLDFLLILAGITDSSWSILRSPTLFNRPLVFNTMMYVNTFISRPYKAELFFLFLFLFLNRVQWCLTLSCWKIHVLMELCLSKIPMTLLQKLISLDAWLLMNRTGFSIFANNNIIIVVVFFS